MRLSAPPRRAQSLLLLAPRRLCSISLRHSWICPPPRPCRPFPRAPLEAIRREGAPIGRSFSPQDYIYGRAHPSGAHCPNATCVTCVSLLTSPSLIPSSAPVQRAHRDHSRHHGSPRPDMDSHQEEPAHCSSSPPAVDYSACRSLAYTVCTCASVGGGGGCGKYLAGTIHSRGRLPFPEDHAAILTQPDVLYFLC